MNTYNKVILIGHIVADPECKKLVLDSGISKPIATFSLATERNFIVGDGKKTDSTDFHRIVCLLSPLTKACRLGLFEKGTNVCVEGKLTNRAYKGANGDMRYITEIIADTISTIKLQK